MVPSAAEIAFALSVVVAVLVAATRRVPLAAALAFPAAVAIGCANVPRRWLPEELAVLAGIVLLSIVFGTLLSWAALRCFYWIPDRLTHPEDSIFDRETERLKSLAELGALGFRPVGALCLKDGLERQVRRYFVDSSGTLAAWVTRNRWGTRGISFCTEQDGARLVTSNWPFIPAFRLTPGRVIFLHHTCRSLKELLRNHRIHLAELAMDAPDSCGDLLEREQIRFGEMVEEVVRRGRLVRDRRGRLRLTLGAIPGVLVRGLWLDFRRKCWRFGR
jgi:hypothetical protein